MSRRCDSVVDTFAVLSGEALEGIVAESVKIVEGRRANAYTPPTERSRYTLDGEPIDLTEFLEANNLEDEVVDEIHALGIGGVYRGGGGAWGEYAIRRIS